MKLATVSKQAHISQSPMRDVSRAHRLDRGIMNDRVKHLTWLSTSEFSNATDKVRYRKQIHDLLLANLAADDSSSPRAPPTQTPTSLSSGAGLEESGNQTPLESASRKQMLAAVKDSSKILDQQFICCIVPSEESSADTVVQVQIPVFEKYMTSDEYKHWLKHVHGLDIVPAEPNGACFFEATLLCIQKLVLSSEGASYKPLPVFAMSGRPLASIVSKIHNKKRHALLSLKCDCECLRKGTNTTEGNNVSD